MQYKTNKGAGLDVNQIKYTNSAASKHEGHEIVDRMSTININ